MRLFYLILITWALFFIGMASLASVHKASQQKFHKVHASKRPSSKSPLMSTMPIVIYGAPQLINQLNSIINAEKSKADIAVYIKSMDHGEVLYSRNISRPLTPASTLKILTAEAALLFLGPEYRFSTQLLTDAKGIKNGVLQGNLYIVLSGDPTLTFNDIVDLMLTLQVHQV